MTTTETMERLRALVREWYRTQFPCHDEPITDDMIQTDEVRLVLSVGIIDGAWRVEVQRTLEGDDEPEVAAACEEDHGSPADALAMFEAEAL